LGPKHKHDDDDGLKIGTQTVCDSA